MNKRRKLATSEIIPELNKIRAKEGINKMQREYIRKRIKEYRIENKTLIEDNERLNLESKLFSTKNIDVEKQTIDENINKENKGIDELEINYLSKLKDQIKKQGSIIMELRKDLEKKQHIPQKSKNEIKEEHVENKDINLDIEKIVEEIKLTNDSVIENFKDEICNLKKELHEERISKNTNNMHNEEIERIKTLKELVEKLNEENLQNFKNSKEEKQIYVSEIQDMEKKIEQLEQNIKILKDSLFEETQEKDKEIKNLQTKLKETEEHLSILKTKNYVEEKHMNFLKERNEYNTTEENKVLISEREDFIKKIQETTKKFERKDVEVNMLKLELKKSENERAGVELDKIKIKKKLSEIAEMKHEYKDQNLKSKKEIEDLQKRVQERSTAASFHKRNLLKSSEEGSFYKRKSEVFREEVESLKEKLANEIKSSEEKIKKIVLLEEELKNYTKIVAMISKNDSTEMILNVDRYRKLLRCTTCDLNFKDTALLKCMHVFCKDCIDSRLKYRNRKCPICGEGFSQNDIKKIFL
ncbi:hypothetical protein SLOPH_1771 [Spraguea lophii 42_110]|uniref:E3 ubiquitin protein ligase n=1 Tax=Spraguea lophii (strain 42_110) TaxID=1358809 RepID=S7W865_SPRLO|nr:hypothetical protein SLOPH_1771 [Spraguea lophii 42_110]